MGDQDTELAEVVSIQARTPGRVLGASFNSGIDLDILGCAPGGDRAHSVQHRWDQSGIDWAGSVGGIKLIQFRDQIRQPGERGNIRGH